MDLRASYGPLGVVAGPAALVLVVAVGFGLLEVLDRVGQIGRPQLVLGELDGATELLLGGAELLGATLLLAGVLLLGAVLLGAVLLGAVLVSVGVGVALGM